MNEPTTVDRTKNMALLFGWAITLFASSLPNVVWIELFHGNVGWMFGAKIILFAALIVAGLFWKPLRAVRNLLIFFIVLFGVEEFITLAQQTPWWHSLFGSETNGFTRNMLGIQLSGLVVSFLIIATLLLMRFRRQDFFLTLGKLDAPIEPARWLGFPKPDPWTKFGKQWAIYISLGTLLFLVVAGRPDFQTLGLALPMLPMVLVLAAMNAFNEEMTYRASMLAILEQPFGPRQALFMSAAFFGIGHFYGVPYGIIGVILASFLGWMLGKAMLETRGFFWAWLIHWLQDIMIFAFIAIGSVTPGG